MEASQTYQKKRLCISYILPIYMKTRRGRKELNRSLSFQGLITAAAVCTKCMLRMSPHLKRFEEKQKALKKAKPPKTRRGGEGKQERKVHKNPPYVLPMLCCAVYTSRKFPLRRNSEKKKNRCKSTCKPTRAPFFLVCSSIAKYSTPRLNPFLIFFSQKCRAR
jgi:hypothetical protein